jgi:ribosomal protein S18 acetylase RimI-like enzyme
LILFILKAFEQYANQACAGHDNHRAQYPLKRSLKVAVLQRIDFSERELPRVQSFACGDDIWCTVAERWIKSPPSYRGAIFSIKQYQTSVWLYLLNNALVGFASLGYSEWENVPPDGQHRKLLFIPQLAVCSDFHGQPKEGDTFASQILKDVLAEAKRRDTCPVGLWVDSENIKAQRFYLRHQFTFIEGDSVRFGRTFRRMLYEPTE